MKKLIFASAFFLLFLFFPKLTLAQVPDCASEVGGACRTGCNSDEQIVTGKCTPGGKTPVFCCLQKSKVTPVACQGTCRSSCGLNEVEFRNVNTCEASGKVCCSVNPITAGQSGAILCSTPTGEGIDTAIGCIPISDTNAFVGFILKWAIGIGGGIAFLLIVVAGFQIMTSSGNPERLKAGQELLTSAIAGLIMIIFSVFILQIIGVTILKLPGIK